MQIEIVTIDQFDATDFAVLGKAEQNYFQAGNHFQDISYLLSGMEINIQLIQMG